MSKHKGLRVTHVHGYWDGEAKTLHTARRLTEERPRLATSLADVMSNSLVIVMGYGGWNDVFSRALLSVIKERRGTDVIWCLLDRRPDGWPEGTLMHELDQAGPDVSIYDGIDVNHVLPRIAAEHNRDPVKRIAGTVPPALSGDARHARQRLQMVIDDKRLTLLRSGTPAVYPDAVVWTHRLREPNLVHAAQATVARALLDGGSRVLVVINDLGRSSDTGLSARFEERIRTWTGEGAESERLTVLRLHDRDVLFPKGVTYEQMTQVLERATGGPLNIDRVIAGAEPDRAPLSTLSWHELLSPVIYWTYLLTLPERGLELERVWTLSGDHHAALWEDFGSQVAKEDGAKGVAHLLVPSPREQSGFAALDGPGLSAADQEAFAEALIASAQGTRPANDAWLALWAWTTLVELPAFLEGRPPEPLSTAAGEVQDVRQLITALDGSHRRDVATALAEQVKQRWHGNDRPADGYSGSAS